MKKFLRMDVEIGFVSISRQVDSFALQVARRKETNDVLLPVVALDKSPRDLSAASAAVSTTSMKLTSMVISPDMTPRRRTGRRRSSSLQRKKNVVQASKKSAEWNKENCQPLDLSVGGGGRRSANNERGDGSRPPNANSCSGYVDMYGVLTERSAMDAVKRSAKTIAARRRTMHRHRETPEESFFYNDGASDHVYDLPCDCYLASPHQDQGNFDCRTFDSQHPSDDHIYETMDIANGTSEVVGLSKPSFVFNQRPSGQRTGFPRLRQRYGELSDGDDDDDDDDRYDILDPYINQTFDTPEVGGRVRQLGRSIRDDSDSSVTTTTTPHRRVDRSRSTSRWSTSGSPQRKKRVTFEVRRSIYGNNFINS